MGGAQEVLGSQGLLDSGGMEHQGGRGILLGAGIYLRTCVLCHQVKSLPLSEPQIDSAKLPQGQAWVI